MTSDKGNRLAKVIPDDALPVTHHRPDPKLDRGIQTRIGDQLRAMYDELMEQPVPGPVQVISSQSWIRASRRERRK